MQGQLQRAYIFYVNKQKKKFQSKVWNAKVSKEKRNIISFNV